MDRGALLAVLVISAMVQGVSRAQSYSAGPAPTIGPIQHECVALYPEPRDRTDIGIGEEVNLWIDPATWSDEDEADDPYGPAGVVQDGMGVPTWSVLSGDGEVYPIWGTCTTLTAGMAAADNAIEVEVAVPDAAAFADDAGEARRKKILNSKVPAAIYHYSACCHR